MPGSIALPFLELLFHHFADFADVVTHASKNPDDNNVEKNHNELHKHCECGIFPKKLVWKHRIFLFILDGDSQQLYLLDYSCEENISTVINIFCNKSIGTDRWESILSGEDSLTSPQEKQFKELVSAYADRIFNHAYRILGNREDAEEAVQDIFIKVYRSLPGFRGESGIQTWLYRITVNTCLSRLRKRKVEQIYPEEEVDNRSPTWDTLVSETDTPEHQLIEKDMKDQIFGALKMLPMEDSEILVLFHVDELKYDEIATVLDIPLGTVCARLYRARKKLKSALALVIKDLQR